MFRVSTSRSKWKNLILRIKLIKILIKYTLFIKSFLDLNYGKKNGKKEEDYRKRNRKKEIVCNKFFHFSVTPKVSRNYSDIDKRKW